MNDKILRVCRIFVDCRSEPLLSRLKWQDRRDPALLGLCVGCCFAEKYVANGHIIDPLEYKCILKETQWKSYLYLYQKISNNYPDYLDELRPSTQV